MMHNTQNQTAPSSCMPFGQGSAVLRPSWSLLMREPWRASLDLLAFKLRARPDRQGDGHPVMLYPGLGADGRQMRPLRWHLQHAGYEAEDWGRGRNTGPGRDVDGFLQSLSDDVQRRADATGQPLTLVGWSLGGLYVREVAKLAPDAVRMVITLGAPFAADEDRSHAGMLYALFNGDRPRLDAALARRLAVPPPVPTLSVYSRSDGVVPWQHCVHAATAPSAAGGATVRDIEVQSSHCSMPWNGQVLRVVSDALLSPADQARQARQARSAAAGAQRPADRARARSASAAGGSPRPTAAAAR